MNNITNFFTSKLFYTFLTIGYLFIIICLYATMGILTKEWYEDKKLDEINLSKTEQIFMKGALVGFWILNLITICTYIFLSYQRKYN